jgi:hypothetical protein
LPLPSTKLFREALRGELDETELPPWDILQAYHSPANTPLVSQNSDTYTTNLIDVMHGRRLRIQKEEATARFKIFQEVGHSGLRGKVIEEAQLVLKEWKAIGLVIGKLEEGTCHHAMAQHLSQWKSRKLCELQKDCEALDLGGDAYVAQYFIRSTASYK